MPITNTTRIIDLPTKSSLGSGDYFAVDNANGDTSKILATSVSGSSTAGLVAKEYSNAQTYDKGDYSIHVENNVPTLYRANQNIPTAETWNAAHWDQTDAGSELTTANADIASLNSNLTQLIKSVEGAIPSNGGDLALQYPTGFTFGNSTILSLLVKDGNGNWRYIGQGTDGAAFSRFFATQTQNGITVSCMTSAWYGKDVRVVLGKI